jgi:hypothetical protein
LGRLSVTLGVVGAGVAVALQDVVASIAGAFSIGFSKLYAVGDRVQIGDTRGDVIDIGLLRTTVMETGNWVSKDLYNGRIVRISFFARGKSGGPPSTSPATGRPSRNPGIVCMAVSNCFFVDTAGFAQIAEWRIRREANTPWEFPLVVNPARCGAFRDEGEAPRPLVSLGTLQKGCRRIRPESQLWSPKRKRPARSPALLASILFFTSLLHSFSPSALQQ